MVHSHEIMSIINQIPPNFADGVLDCHRWSIHFYYLCLCITQNGSNWHKWLERIVQLMLTDTFHPFLRNYLTKFHCSQDTIESTIHLPLGVNLVLQTQVTKALSLLNWMHIC
jgi:hypothetical protein